MKYLVFLFLALIVRVQIAFLDYLDFIYKPIREVDAKVFAIYKKKNYYVLKLKNPKVTFYTISREDLKDLLNENVKVTIFTQKISFFKFLTTFYAPSYNIKLMPAKKIEIFIEKQHQNREISNLFKALFLGESLEFQTRKKLSSLGISHLFALSGLHLGIISFVLYFLFYPFYSFFHKRFPYRNRFVDLGIITLIAEFLYLKFTFFPSSLIRAYVMEVLFFIFFITLRNIINLRVLLYTILVSFFIFLFKIFTIGFFLSIAGVYYIFLFFKYYKPTLINSLILSFYMFIVMFVISHYFFGNMNNYQLLSPFINIIFTIFYPLEIILHLIGIGGIFDKIIINYLSLGEKFYYVNVSLSFLIIFILLSLIAYKNRFAFYSINILGVLVVLSAIRF